MPDRPPATVIRFPVRDTGPALPPDGVPVIIILPVIRRQPIRRTNEADR